jgi:hypothetical protein
MEQALQEEVVQEQEEAPVEVAAEAGWAAAKQVPGLEECANALLVEQLLLIR